MESGRKARGMRESYTGSISGLARMAPHFSVILCTYNRRSLVLTTLASLRRQTLPYDEFEVIVVDNGSTDGTSGAVRRYIRAGMHTGRRPEDTWRVQILSEPRNGLVHARETGLRAAAGEIAVFLDDDVFAHPNFLEALAYAYEQTGADAIGGRVELRWGASCPYWLSSELVDMLGYFAPSDERMRLGEGASFSGSNFSVKIAALRAIGSFSPFLGKRLRAPIGLEVQDLCQRLYQSGYTLWYEPGALIEHYVHAARLKRAFFTGRAYWRGRSDVLAHYSNALWRGEMRQYLSRPLLLTLCSESYTLACLACIQRPLVYLAGRSSREHLLVVMEQARKWGHLRQQAQFLGHAPLALSGPAVLLVRSAGEDETAGLLAQGLHRQYVSCRVAYEEVPLSWLWQHRVVSGQTRNVVHFYRAGAFNLSPREHQRLLFALWLARRWGFLVVVTDPGGWWQGVRGLHFIARRLLERTLMYQSDVVLTYTRQPQQLYRDKSIRRRVYCLPHAGFRECYTPPLPRVYALEQLGLPVETPCVYLCLAPVHTEQELLYLIKAFQDMWWEQSCISQPPQSTPQLLFVGCPGEGNSPLQALECAARHPAIHFSLTLSPKKDMPLYMGAADVIALPHFAVPAAGQLETALLALSYARAVVAPDLPRFNGMLPPQSSILYKPGSQKALAQALLKAQFLHDLPAVVETATQDAASGWSHYTRRLLKIYRDLGSKRS